MKVMQHALRPLGGALLVCAVVVGCGEPITSTPQRPRAVAPATLSRVGTPTSDRHIFALNGDIPSDFAERIAARGGNVVSVQPEIGLVQTAGLTDADASRLAKGQGLVARDFEGQWVPSANEALFSQSLDAAAESVAAAMDVFSARPPQGAVFLPQQWNMFQIHAPEAWASHTGIPSVRVAILDSGLDPDHLDQRGLIDVAASRAFIASTDTVNHPPAWVDDHYHGTYVGGQVTSNNFGAAGVAPNVTLIAVKVLNQNGSGPIGAAIAGIVHATNVGAQVINMSLGITLPKHDPNANLIKTFMTRAVNYAKSHGALVVSASGNEGRDLQHANAYISLPCEAGVQICVSATAPNNTFASYSNYGTNAISVAAPGGGDPPATWVLGLCSSHTMHPELAPCRITPPLPFGVQYITAAGTSAAAPHVSGLAALLDSQFGGTLNASQLITLIEQNADDLGKPGSDPFFGKGQINVFRTLSSTP